MIENPGPTVPGTARGGTVVDGASPGAGVRRDGSPSHGTHRRTRGWCDRGPVHGSSPCDGGVPPGQVHRHGGPERRDAATNRCGRPGTHAHPASSGPGFPGPRVRLRDLRTSCGDVPRRSPTPRRSAGGSTPG